MSHNISLPILSFSVILHPQTAKEMKIYTDEELAQLLDKEIFHLISQVADELGVECYVVGGYVRDIFLERPSNDICVVQECSMPTR